MFYIYGEAQRPGAYRIEREMTVQQALAIGGAPPSAVPTAASASTVRVAMAKPNKSPRAVGPGVARRRHLHPRKHPLTRRILLRSLYEYSAVLLIFFARKGPAIAVFAVTVLTALALSLVLPKTYQATNTVVIDLKAQTQSLA